MSHSIDFFRDEVRNGFYIPTAIKQAWASCLDVLKEVDRICTKYGIRYFADWGSFLGAVRHGGFVPWDDDLDICMLRDDYTRFRKVADKELPKHFAIHDYERKEDHWLFLSRVVSNASICFDEEYMTQHYNFPWLATVDIFVKDYLYKDEIKEKERDKDVMFLITLADGIREGTFEKTTILYHLQRIKEKYHTSLPDIGRTRDLCVALYRLAEKEMSKVKPEEAEMVGQIFPWILKGGKGQPKSYYEKIIRLPFEDTTIPVPACYNTVLASRYGNYNEIHKVWDGHMYPFFEGQRADLEKINGAPLPDRVFDSKLLEKPKVDRSNSLKVIAGECLQELQKLYYDIRNSMNSDDEYIEEMLTTSQQLAIDLGTLVEQVKGEDRECTKFVVSTLESYCEAIFQCFQSLSGFGAGSNSDHSRYAISAGSLYGENSENQSEKDKKPENYIYMYSLEQLSESLDKVCNVVETHIINRNEVLFLTIGSKEWKGFENTYQYHLSQEKECDIYVVPLPLLTKDPLGQVAISEELIKEGLSIEQYPDDIAYTDWQSYDVSQHCPDIIYIQNPYDAENPYLTVPPQYYASNIRKYTEKLVFIPFKDTSEFTEKDGPDIYNLKHYAAAPGVICSDIAIVQSENINQHYIDALTRFAGEDTRIIWEQKIVTNGFPNKEREGKNELKRIIYCIGANELSEHGDVLIESVRNRLETFRENSQKVKTTITFYPDNRQKWEEIDQSLTNTLFDMIDKGLEKGSFERVTLIPKEADDLVLNFDAYYGDPSPLVPAFMIQKKNVMIANHDC